MIFKTFTTILATTALFSLASASPFPGETSEISAENWHRYGGSAVSEDFDLSGAEDEGPIPDLRRVKRGRSQSDTWAEGDEMPGSGGPPKKNVRITRDDWNHAASAFTDEGPIGLKNDEAAYKLNSGGVEQSAPIDNFADMEEGLHNIQYSEKVVTDNSPFDFTDDPVINSYEQ